MEQELVELVWRRGHARCEYCQMAQGHSVFTFEIDHIIAEKHGGATAAENLCRVAGSKALSRCPEDSAPIADLVKVSNSLPAGHADKAKVWKCSSRWGSRPGGMRVE